MPTTTAFVEQMLDLNRRLAAAKAPHEREMLAGGGAGDRLSCLRLPITPHVEYGL